MDRLVVASNVGGVTSDALEGGDSLGLGDLVKAVAVVYGRQTLEESL